MFETSDFLRLASCRGSVRFAVVVAMLGAGCTPVGDSAFVDELRSERFSDRDDVTLSGGPGLVSEPDPSPAIEPEPAPSPTCSSNDQCDRLICDCADEPRLVYEECRAGSCVEASDCADYCVLAPDDNSTAIVDVTAQEICTEVLASSDTCFQCETSSCCSELYTYISATDLPEYDACIADCASSLTCSDACAAAYASGRAVEAYLQCSSELCRDECGW